MGGVGEDQGIVCHHLQILPGHALGQCYLASAISYKESTDHGKVGIGTYALLVVGHRVFAHEASASVKTIGGIASLVVVFYIL